MLYYVVMSGQYGEIFFGAFPDYWLKIHLCLKFHLHFSFTDVGKKKLFFFGSMFIIINRWCNFNFQQFWGLKICLICQHILLASHMLLLSKPTLVQAIFLGQYTFPQNLRARNLDSAFSGKFRQLLVFTRILTIVNYEWVSMLSLKTFQA